MKLHNEFNAVFEKDNGVYIGYCLEIPGANGQGQTLEACKESLAEAITLILEDRREDSLRGLSENVQRDVVIIN